MRLEVLKLVSDRGARWITVRVPSGSQQNVLRTETDLVQPLPDSIAPLLVSGAILLRIAEQVEALLRHGDEENQNVGRADEDGNIAASPDMATSARAVQTETGGADRAGTLFQASRSHR